jgi:hypothetical protein
MIQNFPNSKKTKDEIEHEDAKIIKNLTLWLKRVNFDKYIATRDNPFHLVINYFLAGLAQGFGFILGSTVIIAILLLVLSWLGGIPLIGEWISWVIRVIDGKIG